MDEALINRITSGIEKKKKITFSLDSDVLSELDKICNSKGYKKSRIVENLLRVFIEEDKSLFGTNIKK